MKTTTLKIVLTLSSNNTAEKVKRRGGGAGTGIRITSLGIYVARS